MYYYGWSDQLLMGRRKANLLILRLGKLDVRFLGITIILNWAVIISAPAFPTWNFERRWENNEKIISRSIVMS